MDMKSELFFVVITIADLIKAFSFKNGTLAHDRNSALLNKYIYSVIKSFTYLSASIKLKQR